MIVCHCKGITEREIRSAVREGATTHRQVGRACQAGRSCGGCHPVIREIIEDEHEPRARAFDELAPAS